MSFLCPIRQRPSWRKLVTPKPLTSKPIHNWFYFPHSFTDDLVRVLLRDWGIGTGDRVLDPFVGAGTTLLAARSVGVDAEGVDLSPLAVLVSNVKVRRYERPSVVRDWMRVVERVRVNPEGDSGSAPEFLGRALPGRILPRFLGIKAAIEGSELSTSHRELFLLALLASVRHFSRAVPSGGWVSWVDKSVNSSSVLSHIAGRVAVMLSDMGEAGRGKQQARIADARALPFRDGSFAAVITSPPYLNRHDYTRVFAPELMLGFMDWSELRELRHQSFQSHPESRPSRASTVSYSEPASLLRAIARVGEVSNDRRIVPMVEGYFRDLFLALQEIYRVSKSGAHVAIVIGNVQYFGVPILVDELTAEIGEQVGLQCDGILAARYRGNSAQQMSKYGRRPARESVVTLRKP